MSAKSELGANKMTATVKAAKDKAATEKATAKEVQQMPDGNDVNLMDLGSREEKTS